MAKLAGLAIGSGTQPESIIWFKLDDGPFLPGFIGADYELKNANEGLCEEEIRIRIKGTPAEMNVILGQVRHALRACLLEGSTERAYVRLRRSALDAFVFARILTARFELMPGHLVSKELGSFVLSVKLRRQAQFVGEERRLDVFNSSGPGNALGLTVYNHDDAQIGHDNWFSVLPSGLQLDQACPMRFEFLVPDGGNSIGDFQLGSFVMMDAASIPTMNIEAESGVGGASISDTQASNGQFQRYTWSGSGWATLASWTLTSTMVSKLAGTKLCPILRLHNPTQQSGLRLRLLLKQQGLTVYESPVCLVQARKSAQVFSPMNLSMEDLPRLKPLAGLSLSLEGMQSGLSASLDVDDILFMPQKRFRAFHSLTGLEAKSTLIDDSWRALSWSLKDGQELKTHLSLGRGHDLFPAVEQRFYVFMSDLAGKSPIDLKLIVKAWYRPILELP